MELNKQFKYGEEVYIFADFQNGLPHVYKGRITGLSSCGGIYSFVYHVETATTTFFRFPDGIFRSVDEAAAIIKELVA